MSALPAPDRPARPGRSLVLGLDVGGTKLAAGAVDLGEASDSDGPGATLERSIVRAPSHRGAGPTAMIERLVELGHRSLELVGAGSEDVVAAGIACGGPLDPERGVIQRPMNLPDWDDIPLGDLVATAFGRPSAVENDATAAILAEHRYGAGRGIEDLVYFTISTGIGGGAIVGGRLVRGATGNGAELGHTLADPGLRPCACGRRGCLEGFASGTNIAARAREALAGGRPSVLRELASEAGAITAETVVEAVRRDDPVAREVWDATTTAIGRGIANAINAFDPSMVILGGGVTRAGDLLFEPVGRVALAEAMRPMAANVRIVPAGLGERLGVVAAATVAVERFHLDGAPPTTISAALDQHLEAATALRALLPEVEAVGRRLCEALARGGRLVAFGNGGSAADAQHVATELVGHFRRHRRALPAISLATDPSALTAISNDYGWEEVFARQVEALVTADDLVLAISTSGNAENVIRGVRAARARGALTVALTGATGGRLAGETDLALRMPAIATPRVQELHTFVVHALSEIVDAWAAEAAAGASHEAPRP